MNGTDVLLAGGALAAGVIAGLLAHEWSHAAVLRLAGVDYDVEFFPGRSRNLRYLLAACPWAQVRPHPSEGDPPWVLRIAALAPLALSVPVAAVAVFGGLSTADPTWATAFAIGWLACAVPSPQDFSVVFYAHVPLEVATADGPPSSTD